MTESLKAAAAAVGVDLLVLDNRYDAETAVENAEKFVREQVDIVIEFQVEQHAAPIIGDKIAGANIPLIAVDIPHPHATYFGMDNYRAGCGGGFAGGLSRSTLGWPVGLGDRAGYGGGRADGAEPHYRRLRGCEGAGLPNLPVECFVRMDGRGMRDRSKKLISDFLNRHPKDKHILIAAANDSSAMGAVMRCASRSARGMSRWSDRTALRRLMAEMRTGAVPLIGSVSHEVSSVRAEADRSGAGAAARRDGGSL